ncbi:Crotonyl-CoA hydratase [Alphaproteobacteria bacterium SO-S41]|nr:Crotonyl-CoA hydratase [Alphaproteobacteria bacterium SO-S41]
MTAHHIVYTVDDDGIATLAIERAEKRNAMTWAMLGAFNARIADASADDKVRVLIVTGADNAFCAGTDLADLNATPESERGSRAGTREGQNIWWNLVRCPKPVIGAIDGSAVGMGAEISSQCDVRLVSTRARFAWNFSHRGLVPDTGAGSWLLPRLIGPSRALRLLYSGAFLDAAEAVRIGYADQVVAPGALREAALAEARSYLKSSPFSIRHIKELVWAGLERDVAAHMGEHRKALQACFASEDHKEGVASFLERRPAKFTGR